jgi:L,D-transpeptidase YcbB
MNFPMSRRVFSRSFSVALSVFVILGLQSEPVSAQSTAYKQAVAEAAALDDTVAAWYRTSDYDSLWTSADDASRRAALLTVLESAADHGLPVVRYDANTLRG